MSPEALGRELGIISTNIKILIDKTVDLSAKLESISLVNNTHCNKIAEIEKLCQNRIKVTKWVVTFAISILGVYIAYLKI